MAGLPEASASWRRQRALVLLREGAGRLACWGLALLTAVLWLDAAFLMPQSWRVGLWIAGCAGIAAGAYVWLFRPWRGNTWTTVLDEVALRLPSLRPYLRTAWELRGSSPPHTSRPLAAAHIRATERLLEGLPARPVFRWRASPHLRRVSVAALAALLTWPWLEKVCWGRVLAPWRDVPLERFLVVEPGSAVWALGQPATIVARRGPAAGGPRHPAEARLWLKSSGAWRGLPWDRQLPDAAAFTVVSVAEPLQYRLTWRSLESSVYRLDPKPFAQLESAQAKAAGQAAVPLNGADPLSARRGTWIVVSGRPNQPLARAALTASFLPAPVEFRCAPAAGGEECSAGFLAAQDGTFQFDLEAKDGRRDPAPVIYAFKAIADEPPRAELLSPAAPVQASPRSAIPVAYSARDDSGLTRVTMLVKVPGQAEKEVALQRFGRDAPKEFIGDYPWELSGLPVGAKVAFRVKAYDDAVPAQSGVSSAGEVEIVDFEAGHEAARQSWRKAEESLADLAAREEQLRDRYAADDAEGARQQLPGLPEDWKKSLDAMQQLSQSMDSDAYANPGLDEQFSGLAEQLRQAQSRDLPAALAADKEGKMSAARDGHRRLAEALRRTENSLKKGRSLQELQDFYMEAGRMSQDGERMAAALESMSGSRQGQAQAAEALQRIQDALQRVQERMAALQKTMSSMPQAAPGGREDKARRSYSMPLLEAQTSADALKSALRSGDLATAAAVAKELARQLSAIESALTAAAQAGAAASPDQRGSERMRRLEERWSEVVEEQGRLVEASQGMEERRRNRFLESQKELLSRLAADEAALISSATASGLPLPGGVLPAMKAAQEEFASGRVSRSPELVKQAAAGMRETARNPALAQRAADCDRLAEAQEDIGRRLAAAPAAPPAQPPDAETSSAARRQDEVRAKTEGLGRELQALDAEMGLSVPQAAQNLESAQGEQKAAQEGLDAGDSAGALAHQEKAMELLDQGKKGLDGAASAQQKMEISISAGFSQSPGGVRNAPGGGGDKGVRLEFVPLPTAKDYQPPKEIREELERSLKEKRPAAYDGLIKGYFKRLSQ